MCNVQQAEVAPRPGPSVCRSLFGPVDHAELSLELHSRLREMEEESSRRWDFDFQRGVPLPSTRYVWEESRGDTVPAFYRAPPRVRTPISTPQDDPQPENNSTPDARDRCQPSPSAIIPSQPLPSASQRCQPAPSANITSPGASQCCQAASSSSNNTALNASQWCQAAPSASNSTELNNNNSTQPASSASPEPNRTQPGSCKRAHPPSHITGFFPVKKKSKVVTALCDKLHSRSPILAEHTPRKMLR